MRALKQYRVTLLLEGEGFSKPQLFSNINEVNKFVSIAEQLNRYYHPESKKPVCLIESFDWDKLEYLPHAFGEIHNKKTK